MKIRILTAVLLVSLAACSKLKTYPSTPDIKFKELAIYTDSLGVDTAADLTISFVDGDGDIGLAQSDSTADDFYISFFIKHNGNFEEYPLAIPASQRIPYINHEGKDQSLSGDIILRLKFELYFFPPLNNDTMRFDAYIKDRALHQSNTISTPEVILKTF